MSLSARMVQGFFFFQGVLCHEIAKYFSDLVGGVFGHGRPLTRAANVTYVGEVEGALRQWVRYFTVAKTMDIDGNNVYGTVTASSMITQLGGGRGGIYGDNE